MDKKFTIINYDELPKWESGNSKGNVKWRELKEGFIFKTNHEKYGYNEFEFIKMDCDGEHVYLRWENIECKKILKGGLLEGRIGNLMIKYKKYSNDKITIETPLPQSKSNIMWDMIEEGTVIEVEHKSYGRNVFIFIKNEHQYIHLMFNGRKIKLRKSGFIRGAIGCITGDFIKGFQLELGDRIKGKNKDLTIIDRRYIDGEKKYKYRCNICGFECGKHYRKGVLHDEYWVNERNLNKADIGCSCCRNNAVVPEINSIFKKAPWMISLGVSEKDAKRYSVCNGSKVKVTCPYCKREKDNVINRVYNSMSIGCSCGDGYSRGHKYVRNILEQLNVTFNENVRIEWCTFYNKFRNRSYNGEYDFIIEDKKLIIEVDGSFHRRNNTLSGQSKEESEFIDAEKDKIAKQNGYTVVRIFYNDRYMMCKDDILNSDMSRYFDLSNIDWEKATTFATGNIIKSVCDRWKNKREDDTTGTLAKEYNLSSVTISKYLLVGNNHGWCNYDKREEAIKCALRMSKKNSKMVEVFKDGQLLGTFESCMELERRSKEVFGVKLHQAAISKVCRGEQTNHKGFTFKYLDNIEL